MEGVFHGSQPDTAPRLSRIMRDRNDPIDEELELHLDLLTTHYLQQGLPPDQARRRARAAFGNYARIRRQCRTTRMRSSTARNIKQGWSRMLDILRQDVKFAARGFANAPLFTTLAVLTLALGIGANTAIFSIVEGVLLKPLRFGHPDRLVALGERNPSDGIDFTATAAGTFVDWREQNETLQDLTSWAWDTSILESDGEPRVLNTVLVYPNFFSVLQLKPMIGRGFAAGDTEPGKPGNVAVISHQLWRDRWGADSAVIGRKVILDGRPVTIVGVMVPGVAAPDTDADIWMPQEFRSVTRWDRYARYFQVYGRLRDGVTLDQARADMSRIAAGHRSGEYSDIYKDWDVAVQPLKDRIVGDVRPTLMVAFAAVGLVLLIACVNIANLQLARATSRSREIAVRTALGAGRTRITRQLLTENVMLAIAGGAAGLAVGGLFYRLLLAFQPEILPRAEELSQDSLTLGFALLISLLTGVLFGLAPAWQARGMNVQGTLTQGGSRSTTAGRRHQRMLSTLVAGQVALAVVLLSGATLLIRTMHELGRVDPGFNATDVYSVRLFPDSKKLESAERLILYFDELTQRVSTLPGVRSVGVGSTLPMDPIGINYDLPYKLPGQEDLPDEEAPTADFRVVTPGYFETLEVPLRAGRFFTTADRADTRPVALVNETMAHLAWPGQDPIGKRFTTPTVDWVWYEVVGVVGDVRYEGLGSEPEAEMYMPLAQVPRDVMTMVVRADHAATGIPSAISRAALEVNSEFPVHSIARLESLVSASVASERFYTLVLGLFAGVALVLALAGVYGVLSYWVSQRVNEIGVRMALGASRNEVLALVLRRGMGMAMLGTAIGIAGASAANRLFRSVLYGVKPGDTVTLAAVGTVLILAAFAACYLPGRRASRVEPMGALRNQ